MYVKIDQMFKTPYGEYPIWVSAEDLAIVEQTYARKCQLTGFTPEPGDLAMELELIGCVMNPNEIDMNIDCIQLKFGYRKTHKRGD
jgi:hypothetical protein